MSKIRIVDQQSDTSRKFLYEAVGRFTDTDFAGQVKKIAQTQTDFKKVASERYAWPDARRYPVDSMENTVMSKVYFDAQRDQMLDKTADEIGSRIRTFLNLYDIPEEGFVWDQVKTAEVTFEPRYLVPGLKLCKVAGAGSLKASAELFEADYRNLKIAQRVEFAQNYVAAARELKLHDFPEPIAKYASMMDSDMDYTRRMLELRASAARRRGNDGGAYEKLASKLEDITEPPNAAELTKLAECIHQLDVHNGFDSRKYRNKLPSPYEVVFNKAASYIDEDLGAGPDIDTMTKADVVAQFGEEALDAVEDEDGDLNREKLKNLMARQGGIYSVDQPQP